MRGWLLGSAADQAFLFHDAHERKRREQHHRSLREVEYARGLEDQNESQGHQGIEHARHEPAEDHLGGTGPGGGRQQEQGGLDALPDVVRLDTSDPEQTATGLTARPRRPARGAWP